MTIYRAGPPVENARAVLVLVHGRGACAQSLLGLYPELNAPDVSALALQAPAHSWYPHSFLAPLEKNQPYLDQSLQSLHELVEQSGHPAERVYLLGFSQGACLALEYAARHPRRYAGLMALSGALIGSGTASTRDDLHGTPILLAGGDPDAHVPFSRVEQSARQLTERGAAVDLRRYPGLNHTICEDEILACRRLLAAKENS